MFIPPTFTSTQVRHIFDSCDFWIIHTTTTHSNTTHEATIWCMNSFLYTQPQQQTHWWYNSLFPMPVFQSAHRNHTYNSTGDVHAQCLGPFSLHSTTTTTTTPLMRIVYFRRVIYPAHSTSDTLMVPIFMTCTHTTTTPIDAHICIMCMPLYTPQSQPLHTCYMHVLFP